MEGNSILVGIQSVVVFHYNTLSYSLIHNFSVAILAIIRQLALTEKTKEESTTRIWTRILNLLRTLIWTYTCGQKSLKTEICSDLAFEV